MKVITVVGARPQFVKAAAVSKHLRKFCHEILVHTGQHYDTNMSDVFFEELGIPQPDINLSVGSGSHGKQTADILAGVENIILNEKPDLLLVFGDTNSTLAAALAAAKLHIPLAHVEAGLRSFNKKMPEEVNRILTDHVSDWLFCPTDTAVKNLEKENITKGVYNVGDVMYDAVKHYSDIADKKYKDSWFDELSYLFDSNKSKPESFYTATIHRAENTDNLEKINNILNAFNALDLPVIFPVHPRTKKLVSQLINKNRFENIYFIQPTSYTLMLYLVKNARKVITDSGGLQKEAYMLFTPCITVRDQTEWVETLDNGWNMLCKPNATDIVEAVNSPLPDPQMRGNPYGSGDAGKKIADILFNN